MPGSAYHKVAQKVAEWLSEVPECGINSSTTTVCESLKDGRLEDDEEMVSFDVSSLYTNVPVEEAITVCADLLYNGINKTPPVDKETFIKLTRLSSCYVLMLNTEATTSRKMDWLWGALQHHI